MPKADEAQRPDEPPVGEFPDEDADDRPEGESSNPTVEEIAEEEDAEADELASAHRAYLGAVFEHFGPEAPVHPCPTCQTRGYVEVAMQPDPEVERCDACGGLGLTATGSLVDGNVTRPCVKCHGAGFAAKIGQQQALPIPTAEGVDILPPEAFPFVPAEPLPLPVEAA